MYLILFLYQTTTVLTKPSCLCGCILFCSYIKPQLRSTTQYHLEVVSYSVPISNHNACPALSSTHRLYLILFLYQTTTALKVLIVLLWLYLILFLYQTTTLLNHTAHTVRCILFCSYIKPQPGEYTVCRLVCCILFCSYIKPQRKPSSRNGPNVVSYSVPISNHNSGPLNKLGEVLYLILFLYQTTTLVLCMLNLYTLYLILFLYQTTTVYPLTRVGETVVSYSVPISNHNLRGKDNTKVYVVSYSVPISNHNYNI